MKKFHGLLLFIATLLLVTSTAAAHVVVKPSDALTGSFQTFSMGVPNEKDNPTVSLKLLIPDSLQSVSPTVKPGWTISEDKEGQGEDAKVKSITWTGGSIPTGQRDDFTFSAKTPDQSADLQWKAYQTYQNGEVVAWDQDPSTIKQGEEGNPFSVTKVAGKATAVEPTAPVNTKDTTSRSLGVAALVIAFIALAVSTRKPTGKNTNKS